MNHSEESGRIIWRQNHFGKLASFCHQIILFSIVITALTGCMTGRHYKIPRGQKAEVIKMETTGYCKCGICCGWERNWRHQPVFSSGPNKGKFKKIGITASGTKAGWGTIAADTRYYPFGTIMYIPDYGWGRVEDIGGAIKGQHIDLFFPSHAKALEWGRQWKTIKVWRPRS